MSIVAIQTQAGIQSAQQGQQNQQTSASNSNYTQLGQAGLAGGLSSTTVYQGYGSPGSIYQSPYYGYTQSTYTEPDIALRKVENGWILKMKGKEYILNGTDKVEKYLKLFLE